MSREWNIHYYGLEVVEAKEAYWLSLGYRIDYAHNLLIKVTNETR